MTKCACDFCGNVILDQFPRAHLQVPMRPADSSPATSDGAYIIPAPVPVPMTSKSATPTHYYVQQFDVCLGCVRGLLRFNPGQQRAIDNVVAYAEERVKWQR